MQNGLASPYPWFGGKSKVTPLVWSRFGQVRNYVEPFMGSMAMLLGRPGPWSGTETVNDLDGFVPNFWRAIQADPDGVAKYADWPVSECDLHARHVWLVGQRDSITAQLEGDPDWFDAKVAGWWVWGQCSWIAGGWCSGKGPWQSVLMDDGTRQLVKTTKDQEDNGSTYHDGVRRKRVDLGNAGRGVNRQLVHLGNAGRGVKRQLVHLGDGRGVNRQRVHLGDAGQGGLYEWFSVLQNRLRHVRVCCGDWSRVCGDTPTVHRGMTAVFLDPPYAESSERDPAIYSKDSGIVSHAVREWAIEHGTDPRMRICLAGYEGEHEMPPGWACVGWKAKGGYGSQSTKHDNPNAKRERLWFSPHCLSPMQQQTAF